MCLSYYKKYFIIVLTSFLFWYNREKKHVNWKHFQNMVKINNRVKLGSTKRLGGLYPVTLEPIISAISFIKSLHV